jgi:hypothetical protein
LRLDVSSIVVFVLLALVQPADAVPPRTSPAFQTTRTFELDAGRATRTFTLHERDGVILINRLTVLQGVRAVVEARIPGLAGARVSSWTSRNDPSLVCGRRGAFDVCTQSEEWCPTRPWETRPPSDARRQRRHGVTDVLALRLVTAKRGDRLGVRNRRQ